MKYYIAADGGGTKTISILYDENLNIINTVKRSGSAITMSNEQMKKEFRETFLKFIPRYVTEIEALDCSIVAARAVYAETLKSILPVHEVKFHIEGDTPLATVGAEYGIVAQAGTGSDAFVRQPNDEFIIGGWGFVLGDEGSGYDIGLKSLKAAICHIDGRGEKTAMHDMIWDEWQLKDNYYDLVYKIAESPEYRPLIASVTKITSRAAALGDKVAISIYENAGMELALQVKAAINKLGGKWEGPIITSGRAWKGSPYMRAAFDKAVLSEYPASEIKWPNFEPIVGCVMLRQYQIGNKFEAIKDKMHTEFADFIYEKPQMKGM